MSYEFRSVQEPTIRQIQDVVCAYYNVSRIDLLCYRRHKEIVEPRHMAIALACSHTKRSLPVIGREFGGRDHTTALHAMRKITFWAEKDPEVMRKVRTLGMIVEALNEPVDPIYWGA